ncbi:MAG: hypothetical protein GX029_07205 [Pseudomonadaceae bacterium]|nr:hypothetical protein [Pseudomonadaceae bacterium]
MFNTNDYSLGFTLLELLLSLLFTALMVMGVSQYLLISVRVHLIMQQETLAARTLETLLLQASLSPQNKSTVQTASSSKTCPSEAVSQGLDLTSWCQAIEQLPQLNFSLSSSPSYIEWQSPSGKKKIQR